MGLFQFQINRILRATSSGFKCVVSIFFVFKLQYFASREALRSIIPSVRKPAAISPFSRRTSSSSLHINDTFISLQQVILRRQRISSIILCSCITQQNIMLSYAEQPIKLLSSVQILFVTISLVSDVTMNGCEYQHQSPSRNTLFSSIFIRLLPTVVFPTPIVPPIKYKFFTT